MHLWANSVMWSYPVCYSPGKVNPNWAVVSVERHPLQLTKDFKKQWYGAAFFKQGALAKCLKIIYKSVDEGCLLVTVSHKFSLCHHYNLLAAGVLTTSGIS